MRALFLLVPLSALIPKQASAQTNIWNDTVKNITGNLYFGLNLNSGAVYTNITDVADPTQDVIINGDLNLSDGSEFYNQTGTIIVIGNLYLSAASTFKNDGDIYVYGNIINDQPMTSGTEGTGTCIWQATAFKP